MHTASALPDYMCMAPHLCIQRVTSPVWLAGPTNVFVSCRRLTEAGNGKEYFGTSRANLSSSTSKSCACSAVCCCHGVCVQCTSSCDLVCKGLGYSSCLGCPYCHAMHLVYTGGYGAHVVMCFTHMRYCVCCSQAGPLQHTTVEPPCCPVHLCEINQGTHVGVLPQLSSKHCQGKSFPLVLSHPLCHM